MRIFVLDTYYPAFLAEHYRRDSALAKCAYDEQLSALMDRCFGTSDAYSRHLGELGHEPMDVVANSEPLQVKWAEENGFGRSVRRLAARSPGPLGFVGRRALLRRIALDQVRAFDPDVVYLQDLWFFKRWDLQALRRSGRLVAGQIASGLPPAETLACFDLLTTSFPHFVERFREQGLDGEYLKIAFDTRVLDRLRERGVEADPGAPREHAATFVGGLDPRVHGAGIRVLERAAGSVGVEVWGYGGDRLPGDSPIRARWRGEAWGLEMYEVLARSRVALNRHIDLADGYANNMRLFEATGVGALLVTESRRNLAELFEPGREVVAYEDEDDLVEKVRHYLADDAERTRVAAAGQARTLREHTYANRMRELAGMLEARLR